MKTHAQTVIATTRAVLPNAVFTPLVARGKVPVITAWQETPFTDDLDIEIGFAEHANAGVILQPGDIVIDVDVRDGKLGNESLKKLLAEHGSFPPTLVVRTPSGGQHWYFRGVHARRRIGKLGPGLDLLGANSFVVAPGSITAEGTYTVVHPGPPAAAPKWVADWCARHAAPRVVEKRKTRDGSATVELDQDTNVLQARAWLRAIPADRIPVAGARNETAYAVACRVVDYGVSAETAFDLISAEWQTRLAEPLSDAELAEVIAHSLDYRQEPVGVRSVHHDFEGVDFTTGAVAAPVVEVIKPGRRILGLSDIIAAHTAPPRALEAIPERKWIIPDLVAGGVVSALVGPPGGGKSMLALTIAQAVASGVAGTGGQFAGFAPNVSGNVLVINAEDDRDEMERRLGALAVAEGVDRLALPHKVTLVSGADAGGLPVVATADRSGQVAFTPLITDIREYVRAPAHKVVLVIVDPFVGSHWCAENDNRQIDQVVDAWRQLAAQTGCAVLLLHHTRKPAVADSGAANLSSPRGASAFTGAVRVQTELTPMGRADARLYGLTEAVRGEYYRLDVTKSNYGRSGHGFWLHRRPTIHGPAFARIELEEKAAEEAANAMRWVFDLIPNGDGMKPEELFAAMMDDEIIAAALLTKADGSQYSERYASRRMKALFGKRVELEGERALWLDETTGTIKRSDGP